MHVSDDNKTARDCSYTDAVLAGFPASCFDLVRSALGPNWTSLHSTVLTGICSNVQCFVSESLNTLF